MIKPIINKITIIGDTMDRRRFVGLVAVGIIGGSSGCLDQSSSDSFDVCESPVISYRNLPEPARKEVDIALDTGQYETEDGLLWGEITESEPDLLVGSDDRPDIEETTIYHSFVEVDSDIEKLRFVRDEGNFYDLSLRNETSKQRTIHVSVSNEAEDEPVFTDTAQLTAEAGENLSRVFPGYGEYEIIMETDERSKTAEWEYSPSAWTSYSPEMVVKPDDISFRTHEIVPGLPDEYHCARIWGTR